ncbi:MAG TPA: M23 family metallopeptidase [Actinomycetota bacterium]
MSASLVGWLALVLSAPARAQIDLPKLPPLPSLPPLPLLTPPSPAPAPGTAQQPPAPGKASSAPKPVQSASKAAPAGPAPQLPNCITRGLAPKGKYTPPGDTKHLQAKGQPLYDIGLPRDRVMEFLAPPFPVAGPARYTDDWQAPRFTPCFHLHEGTDIFAPKDTPVVAPGPGTVVAFGDHPIGGLSIWLTTDDHMSFYMCHLSHFAAGLTAGQRVDRGTVIGYVGNTGDAEGGPTHLHFQVHPPILDRDGQPVKYGIDRSGTLGQTRTPPTNPKQYLDRWLAQSEGTADGLVKAVLKRGGALPNDPGAIADLAHSVLVSDASLFSRSNNANKGIATAAGLLGAAALAHTFGVIGKGARSRRGRRPKAPDTRDQSWYEARRAAEAEATRAREAAAEANLHRRRLRPTPRPPGA